MKLNDHMHVIHIITKLEMGGAQKVCLTIKKGLDEQGLWAGLISGTEGALCARAADMPNTIFVPEMTRELSISRFYREFSCFFKLIRTLRTLKKTYPNIMVHTHSTKAGLIGRWAAFFAGIKKRIHTIHGFGFHNHQNPFIHFCVYMLEFVTSFITTHYICVSSIDAKRGIAIFPFFSKKHTIIRAAVDYQHFIQTKKLRGATLEEHNRFVFGSAGVFRKGKNHIELFQAFELVHKAYPHTRLELLGDGILRPVYEQWIKEHNLQKAIILHGWQMDVAPIMRHWHAFAFSSLWEGMPCAIVEARLLSLPVITYETGGVRDVIIDKKNGFIYKQHDWKGLADGMISLIENETLYKSLAEYPDDLSDFNDQQMINQHIDLYKSL